MSLVSKIGFFGILFLLLSQNINAQSFVRDSLYHISTWDGNQFSGVFTGQSDSTVQFESFEKGLISQKLNRIKKCILVPRDQAIKEKYIPYNPHSNYAFIFQNAFNVRRGQVNYQNVYFLINQLDFGMTKHISFFVGTLPLFIFNKYLPVIFWLGPKYSVPIIQDKITFAVGAFAGFMSHLNSYHGSQPVLNSLTYGILTYGNRRNNLSIGGGFFKEFSSAKAIPYVNISANLKISTKSYLMFENNTIFEVSRSRQIYNLGIRTVIQNFGISYGLLWNPQDFKEKENNLIKSAIPFVGFGYSFGKTNVLKPMKITGL